MGISKLTCTLKGEVPPKWSLDEDVPVAIDRLKDVGKILHHLSLCRARACSSNRLIESFAPPFFFSATIEGFLGVRE
jgi:hypothetical protein